MRQLPMNIKPLSDFNYEENKDKKGFFFLSNVKSSSTAIETLCQTIINTEVAKHFPEVYQEKNLTIFVYGDDSNIFMPEFFRRAKMATDMGLCKVGCLRELNEILN